ncbi:50S ribosomal protein L17 [bacterium]|nr:50S ribosomal protein L17 [bacterium]
MRHKIKSDKFNRFSSYHKATIKSIASSVLLHQKIVTTKIKAKSARRAIEKIITLGKKNTLSARRRAFSLLCDHKLVKILFDQIAPAFANRIGGYTRVIHYRNRRGDNAKLVILELTEKYKKKKSEKVIKEEKKPQVSESKNQEPGISKKEKSTQPKEEIREEERAQKEESIKTAVEEKKELPQQEKPHSHPQEGRHKEKEPEAKKPRKFFKGFKGFFKKERDSL